MENNKIGDLEIVISKFLRIGVIASAATISIGLLMFLVSGYSGYPGNSYPTTPTTIIKGFLLLKPYAIIMTGLLILISTPVFRVGVSIILFFYEKDYLYVEITATVFIILVISFMLGKVG